jgi:hypothetical protein
VVRREEVQPDVGRVTAGIPSLDSPTRFQQDSDLVRKDYAQQIEADIQAKEASSIAPDGEKSRTILDASKGKQITAAEMIRRLSALNGNLWFERSKAAPSEMGVYLKIPVTVDTPEGLEVSRRVLRRAPYKRARLDTHKREVGAYQSARSAHEAGYAVSRLQGLSEARRDWRSSERIPNAAQTGLRMRG